VKLLTRIKLTHGDPDCRLTEGYSDCRGVAEVLFTLCTRRLGGYALLVSREDVLGPITETVWTVLGIEGVMAARICVAR
jgi:hypothetical protein